MMVRIPSLLSQEQVAHVRGVLAGTDWVDGKVTAGAPIRRCQAQSSGAGKRACGPRAGRDHSDGAGAQ